MGNSKQIGLLGAIAIIVGTVIGASIFVLLGPIAGNTGPSLPLAYLVALLPALFGAFFYAQLGAAMPTDGGSYYYTKRMMNPTLGYIVAITLILGGTGAISMLAIGFADYMQFFFPDLSIKVTAIVIIVILLALNLFGFKMAEIAQILMTLWILLALLAFAIPGLFHIDTNNLTPLTPNGMGSFLMGSALAVYSYIGFGIISEIGGTVKDPQRNLPRAIFISLGMVVVLYVLVSLVAVGVIPWQQLSESGASVAEAAQVFLPTSIMFFISIGALFATVTTINAIMMTIPGDFVALGREGIFNRKVMDRTMNGTNVFPITFISVLAIIGVLTGLSSDFFATITIVGLLLNTVVLGFVVYRLPKKENELYMNAPFRIKRGLLNVIVVIGVTLNIIFIVLAVLDFPIIIALFIVWIIGGLLYHRAKIAKIAS